MFLLQSFNILFTSSDVAGWGNSVKGLVCLKMGFRSQDTHSFFLATPEKKETKPKIFELQLQTHVICNELHLW